MSRPQIQNLTTQEQLLTNLISDLTKRRTSPTYSTAYFWNSQALIHTKELLDTANSTLCTLLRRVIRNADWFAKHYKAQLLTLQETQAQEAALAARKEIADVFEHDRAVRLEIGVLIDKQAQRAEDELRVEAARRFGPESPLGSHPVVRAPRVVEGPRQELMFQLDPPECLVLKLEIEFEIQEKLRAGRGVVDGIDEDMIMAYWSLFPDEKIEKSL